MGQCRQERSDGIQKNNGTISTGKKSVSAYLSTTATTNSLNKCLLLQKEKKFIADKKVPVLYAFPITTALNFQ